MCRASTSSFYENPHFTDHYRDYPMVLVRLSKAKRAIVEPLLRRHWRTLASKKAVREFDESLAMPSLRAKRRNP